MLHLLRVSSTSSPQSHAPGLTRASPTRPVPRLRQVPDVGRQHAVRQVSERPSGDRVERGAIGVDRGRGQTGAENTMECGT